MLDESQPYHCTAYIWGVPRANFLFASDSASEVFFFFYSFLALLFFACCIRVFLYSIYVGRCARGLFETAGEEEHGRCRSTSIAWHSIA
jgi:hypothetical protein